MSLVNFTGNQKTILSIDFDRTSTCIQICDYCYVDNMERIYPAYLNKITKNSTELLEDSAGMAKRLNDEYKKARKSKAKQFARLDKLPVRVYGSGDFIPEHLDMLTGLDFKYFIISKNLTETKLNGYIVNLLRLDNTTNIMLSFDNENISNYANVESYYGMDKVGFCYTGLPDDLQAQKDKGYKFDVFFNISHKKLDVEKAKLHRERCPADTGEMKLQQACSTCNKCWKSSITSKPQWNTITYA